MAGRIYTRLGFFSAKQRSMGEAIRVKRKQNWNNEQRAADQRQLS